MQGLKEKLEMLSGELERIQIEIEEAAQEGSVKENKDPWSKLKAAAWECGENSEYLTSIADEL